VSIYPATPVFRPSSARAHTSAGFVSFIIASILLAGSSRAQECVDCHTDIVGAASDVTGQMKGSSHHVQGITISGRHCYACHWEATSDGRINKRYHTGDKSKGAVIDLVVWSAGKRPTAYKPDITVTMFKPSLIATPRERDAVAKITKHCLSCHSDQNNDTRPFAGDTNTPRQYAWDGQSVAARYSQKGTTRWGKYSTAQSNRKMRVIKAYSAHGNAAANQGGWTAATGYDGDMPVTRGGLGSQNIECFDCHNSHGSRINGITTSYTTFDGSRSGGLLKQTRAGKGGYRATYQPSSNLDASSQNPYNAGAGLCFDCHETAQSGVTPWGYRSTFVAAEPVIGYKDTLRFGPGSKGSTTRFAGRQTHTDIASSHLKAGRFLNYSALGHIDGLCTPCHDPHGVSPTLGDAMPYALPLLKGTWLASPYREDAPPTTMPTRGAYAGKSANMSMSWEKGELKGSSPDAQAAMSYNTDRNTFGEGRHITESEEQFGGLCLKCHRKESFTGNRNDTIHRAVKGWGANREHAFPCSKCHQTHNSGLPRLMQTNCLESGPAGLRDSGAAPWFTGKNENTNRVVTQPEKPNATRKTVKESVVGCHVRRAGNRASGPPASASDKWNSVNPW
jgi:hypothetical protein